MKRGFTDIGTTKKCSACSRVRPLVAFNKRRDSPDGRQSRCRECDNGGARSHHLANRDERRAYMRAQDLRRNYGITPADYLEGEL